MTVIEEFHFADDKEEKTTIAIDNIDREIGKFRDKEEDKRKTLSVVERAKRAFFHANLEPDSYAI